LFIQTSPGESNVGNHCCCLVTSRLSSCVPRNASKNMTNGYALFSAAKQRLLTCPPCHPVQPRKSIVCSNLSRHGNPPFFPQPYFDANLPARPATFSPKPYSADKPTLTRSNVPASPTESWRRITFLPISERPVPFPHLHTLRGKVCMQGRSPARGI
jgi:hypothetical protein